MKASSSLLQEALGVHYLGPGFGKQSCLGFLEMFKVCSHLAAELTPILFSHWEVLRGQLDLGGNLGSNPTFLRGETGSTTLPK